MVQRMMVALMLLAVGLLPCWADEQFSIVSPAWVAAHSMDATVRILDLRNSFLDYFTGHVPNAVYIADISLRGPKNGMPVEYYPTLLSAELFSRAGVRSGQTVVVYSDGDNTTGATMAAYILERIGFPKTAIVDGGWSAYQAAQPTSQAYPSYTPVRLPSHENTTIGVDLTQVKALLGKPGVVFIDARPANEYAGAVKTWIRNGHIPGAINIPWTQLMDPANLDQFKSPAEMEAIFAGKGIKKTDNIILYCGTSRDASLEFLVLRHLLGYTNARLYEGSWKEYSAHTEMPIATGTHN